MAGGWKRTRCEGSEQEGREMTQFYGLTWVFSTQTIEDSVEVECNQHRTVSHNSWLVSFSANKDVRDSV